MQIQHYRGACRAGHPGAFGLQVSHLSGRCCWCAVSNNGDAYSNTAVLFEVQRPLLHSVFPLCGPQLGSTTVVITGVGMPKALVESSLTTAVLLLQPCTRQGTFHV